MHTETFIELDDGTSLGAFIGGSGEAGTVVLVAPYEGTRHNPRNQLVADVLQARGFRTVLADLLTEAEEGEELSTPERHFDDAFLTARLTAITNWLVDEHGLETVGYFGANSGACITLEAAAAHPRAVGSVVVRGCGHLDHVGDALRSVAAPTLFVAGEKDGAVVEASRRAVDVVAGEADLEVVPGASHRFEEGGALDTVGAVAADWFGRHLTG